MNYIIKDCTIINEDKRIHGDLMICNERIEKIGGTISTKKKATEINGYNLYLLPGIIDDQVHFREPGLTYKATIYSEAKAAVAGGITSFMEMPNTLPPALTGTLLEDKYARAAQSSLANYSFYMGASNNNMDEIIKLNAKKEEVCGVKIFMGSSTGNLLVDNEQTLEEIFKKTELLIATHCEDEKIIRHNYETLKQQKKELTVYDHPVIRNAEACFQSSSKAIQYAKKYNSRLHILHITTEKELPLFTNSIPLKKKRITAEVCVHHLHFTSDDYQNLGYLIKCNPAIKAPENKAALWNALLDDRLDVIATDHAPHTLEEKSYMRNTNGVLDPIFENDMRYEKAHAGVPLVQHALQLMIYYSKQGKISLEKLVSKMSHAVANCFAIKERGFIREGYFADLVLIDMNKPYSVSNENILYKCGWSPFEASLRGNKDFRFPATILYTFINGHLAYDNGRFDESKRGKRLLFER